MGNCFDCNRRPSRYERCGETLQSSRGVSLEPGKSGVSSTVQLPHSPPQVKVEDCVVGVKGVKEIRTKVEIPRAKSLVQDRKHSNVPISPSPIASACLSTAQISSGSSNTIVLQSPSSPAHQSSSSSSEPRFTVRIATWNLQRFDDKKAGLPGVLDVICTIIIKHGFDVLAVQEIGSKGSPLKMVCKELNNPTLEAVKALGNNERQWKYNVSPKFTGRMFGGVEYDGFLWNESSGLQILGSYLMVSADVQFVRKPFVGNFQGEVECLHLLVSTSEDRESDIILIGDFNCEPTLPWYNSLRECNYINVFDSNEPTNISARNLKGNKCYDNIWISAGMKDQHCDGEVPHRIIRRNLQHPNIIDDRNPDEPGTVSDHCPIWAGFSV